VLTAAGSSDTRLQLWRNPAAQPEEARRRVAPVRLDGVADDLCRVRTAGSVPRYRHARPQCRGVGDANRGGTARSCANATIINVGEILENSTRPVRVIADVFKPTPGLLPNGTATMVVHPK
jgi:hypothetical protein